jgi:autotransporter-associated beta strand protein
MMTCRSVVPCRLNSRLPLRIRRFAKLAAPVLGLLIFALPAGANILSWSGGGASAFWSDSGNWGFVGTPTNGDTLIFSASQPRLQNTNDIATLTLNQIRFVGGGGGYTIFGNGIILTNGIEATNSAVSINTINFNIANSTAGFPTNFVIDTSGAENLILGGVLSGTADMTKTGNGLVIYQAVGSNPYTGTTRVNTGTLELNVSVSNAFSGPLVIGDGTGIGSPTVRLIHINQINDSVPVTLNFNGLLDVNGFPETISPSLTMNGGNITTGTGTLTLADGATIIVQLSIASISGNLSVGSTTCLISNSFPLLLNAVVSGSATITKTGPSHVDLGGANTYTGLTIVQQGALFVENNLALGGTNNGTVVSTGASLILSGGIGITNETLTLNGVGNSLYAGALATGSNLTNVWAGPIILNATSTIACPGSPSNLRIQGPISGPGGLFLGTAGGPQGILYLEGTTANTYGGSTVVSNGMTVFLNKPYTTNSVPGNLDIQGTVHLLNSEQITNTADVQVRGGALFDFGSQFESIDTLHGSGNITFVSLGYLNIGGNNGSSTFDGLMSGTGFPGGYTVGKFGTGSFTLTANNTYLNANHVFAGTLIINGIQPQNPVILELASTIGGDGEVGGISGPGSVSPGPNPGINSPGILNAAGSVNFTSANAYVVDINGPNPGANGYDRLNLISTNIVLGGAALDLWEHVTTPLGLGDQLFIITANNVSGTFNGLPNGSSISLGGYTYVINYSPTAVTLTVTNVPGAITGSSVSSGNGNHAIDPNECNNLFLIVSNQLGVPMTGVSASLSAVSTHSYVSQSISAYPDIPANGTATNLTAFQLSTLPGFNCGDTANLQLSVFSSQGAFNIPIALQSGESGAPFRFDNNATLAIPDIGSVESSVTVGAFTGPLKKVTVALYITHGFDGDLTNISLIGPDGTTVMLSAANGGGGLNYGSSCTDGSRTTFDDAAGTSITAGSAPFVGTFSPQQPLSAFIGKTNSGVNGIWRLHIADGFGGSLGTLRCWSLFLSPTACAPGGGMCDACFAVITNSITTNDPLNSDRLSRTFQNPSTCAAPTFCPGGGNFESPHYDTFNITNYGPATCVSVHLDDGCGTLFSAAYIGSYDPTDLCSNYLADIASDVFIGTYSFSVPAQTNFVIVVNEVPSDGPGCDYTLIVTRDEGCQPLLNIAPVLPSGTNADLFWSSASGGYNLEATPALSPAAWSLVTNEPLIFNADYHVTNSLASTNRFYRLHKP